MSKHKIPCTVGILTYNSSKHLERCLESVRDFDEILIADGGSTDETLEIAKRYGCTIISQSVSGKPITDFAHEKNLLLAHARYDWFFCLDSDEFISQELVREIQQAVEGKQMYLAYHVPWKVTNADGSVIYRSFKPYYQFRFFNRTSGARFVRRVHERVTFKDEQIPIGTFKGCWYVPLDEQRSFAVYKGKVDHRIRIMVEDNPPRSLPEYLRRLFLEPAKNIGKQFIKFIYLRIRYPWDELTPAFYELYKLYGQWVFVREATIQYLLHTRTVLKTALYGGAYIVRTLIRLVDASPEVTVLMYHSVQNTSWKHSVSPEVFERQIAYIAKKCHPVPLVDVVDFAQGKSDLLHKSVAITFDDGYEDFATHAVPILEKYNVPATLFLTTDLEEETGKGSLKRISSETLKTLVGNSLITIESHGRSHRMLAQLEVAEITRELTLSKRDIQALLNITPQFFAYAYGGRSPMVEQETERVGYKAAFGITEGLLKRGDKLFSLRRVQVDKTTTWMQFVLRLTGASSVKRCLFEKVRYNAL